MSNEFKNEIFIKKTQEKYVADSLYSDIFVKDKFIDNSIKQTIIKDRRSNTIKNNLKDLDKKGEVEGIIAYENLRSYPYNFLCIKSMKIVNEINNHGTVHIEGIIDQEIKDDYVYSTEELSPISIYCQKDKSFEYLFNGNVTNIKTICQNEFYYVYIEAKSYSYTMDIYKNYRDFQNVNMTTHELIDSVMESYPNTNYEINIPNEAIGNFILQYNETDYEFLKRILSKYSDVIICDVRDENSYIYFGIPDIKSKAKFSLSNYYISKDVYEYDDMIKNYNSNISENSYITYKVWDENILNVGENLPINNQNLYVKKAEYIMKDEKIEKVYYLRLKDGLKSKKLYNMNLIGVSIYGNILEVKRDKVKVNLEISNYIKTEEAYWFPYATPAASPDGGGWYCMPEEGERIRLNLPTKDEQDAFVVNAIDGYAPDESIYEEGSSNERMSTPDNKSLKTDANKEIKFTPDGVFMEADGNQAFIKLNKDGTVEIKGQKNISIACSNNLTVTANKELSIKAQNNIDILDETGGNIIMTGGNNIKVTGKNTNNNGQA